MDQQAGPVPVVVPELPPVPRPRRSDTRLIFDAVTYAIPLGFRPLLMDVHVPAGATEPVPCVVWIHGGAWWEGDRRWTPAHWPQDDYWFRSLVDAGLAVATIDYRLSGEAVFPAQLADAQAALRYLRHHAAELGITPDRIGVAGESAGGHLAAMVALTGDVPVEPTDRSVTGHSTLVQAAVPLYAVTDLLDFTPEDAEQWAGGPMPEDVLLGGPVLELAEEAAAASPLAHVRADGPPMLLIHGAVDTLVPPSHSERLAEALREVGGRVALEIVPGGEHCFVGADPLPPLAHAVAFLAEHLGARP